MEDWKNDFALGVKVDQVTERPPLPILLHLTVPIKMYWAPQINGTSLRFKMGDSDIRIYHEEKEIGNITGCLGGKTELHVQLEGNYGYILNPDDLWHAFMLALQQANVKLPEGYL